ncbi:hypothetical protein VTJ83DRAFT_1676 [Remersonia thermophila]|uniref:Ribosomal protein S24/S35 mitochondrial conserved domain-containing protein n=1 Tax=Remersonia thermophila TaxID=72144 RepID=A0ABR4DIX0_9PEZI
MFQRSFRRLMAAAPAAGARRSNRPPPPATEAVAKLNLPPAIPTSPPANANPNIQIHPSRRVKQFLFRHAIALPGVEKILAGHNYQKFPLRVFAAPQHVLNFYDLKYLDQREDPLTDKILDFYETKKRENPHLWTYVQGKTSAEEHKVVVRHASERRARAALFCALDAAGYDKLGNAKDGTKVPLHGTLRVLILKPKEALKVDFQDLVQYMSKLVGNAMRQLAVPPRPPRPAAGSRAASSPGNNRAPPPGLRRPPHQGSKGRSPGKNSPP